MAILHPDDVLSSRDSFGVLKKGVWRFTPAQVKASRTTPLVLVVGTPNHASIPVKLCLRKEPGTAYQANGNTNLVLQDSTLPLIQNFRNTSVTDLLVQTAETVIVARTSSVFSSGTVTGILFGLGIVLRLDTADLGAAGTGNLIVHMVYELMPKYPDFN